MLNRFLTTANTQGSLDFISNLIELNNYNIEAKNDIESIINQNINTTKYLLYVVTVENRKFRNDQ